MTDFIINDSLALCACGCGNPTPTARKTSKRDGTIKGQPTAWLKGHYARKHNPHKPIPIEQRFWKHVDQSMGPHGCWEWSGYRSKQGYGQVQVDGQPLNAHRVSYEMAYGAIPPGLIVRHTCDNPPCVNPSHLAIGTHKENTMDAARRRRLHPQSALTPDDVRNIRHLFQTKQRTRSEIARMYGLSYNSIWYITVYRAWDHVE